MAMFEEFMMNSSDASPEHSPPSFPTSLAPPKAKRQPTARPRKSRPLMDGLPEIKIPAVTKPRSAAAAQPRKRALATKEKFSTESPFEEQLVSKKRAPTAREKPLPDTDFGDDVFEEQLVSKKPRVERSRAEKPTLERLPAEKPLVGKSRVDKSRVDKTRFDKPWVENVRVEKPKVEKTKVEKTKAEKPKVDKTPRVEKAPRAEKPRTEKTRTEKTKGEKVQVEKSRVEKPRVDQPRLDKSRGERPLMEHSFLEKPRVTKSPVERVFSENPQIQKPRAENAKAEKRRAKKPSTESARVANFYVENPRVEKSRPEKSHVEKPFLETSLLGKPYAEPQAEKYQGKKTADGKAPRKPKVRLPEVAATAVPKIVKPAKREEVFESQEERTDSDRELEFSYKEQSWKRKLYAATKQLEDILEVTTGMVDELHKEEQDAKRLEDEKGKLLDELLVWEGLADVPQSTSMAPVPVENHFVPLRPPPVENPYSQYVPVMTEENFYPPYIPVANSYVPYVPVENPYATYMPVENSYHQFMPNNPSRKPKGPRT